MKALLQRFLLSVALLAACCPGFAQIAATVEGVQMPAWVERNGVRQPIVPGMELRLEVGPQQQVGLCWPGHSGGALLVTVPSQPPSGSGQR